MKSARAVLLALVALLGLATTALARDTISLNGEWQVAFAPAATPPGAEVEWSPVLVPGVLTPPAEGPQAVWYRRSFYLPTSWTGQRLVLRVGGARFTQKVYVNGREIGSHLGGFEPSEYDLTGVAATAANNDLLICVQDWTALLAPGVKVEAGADPRTVQGGLLAPVGPTSWLVGLWGDVSIDARAPVWVEDAFPSASVQSGTVRVVVRVRNATPDPATATVTARISGGGTGPEFAPQEVTVPGGGVVTTTLSANWPDAILWSPTNPHLYRLVVGAQGNWIADAIAVPFGFRDLSCQDDALLLNGLPTHLLVASFPEVRYDLDPAPALQLAQAVGANAVRLGGGPWPAGWYDAADQMGLLVIAESAISDPVQSYRLGDEAFGRNVNAHLTGVVESLRAHPSVIVWNVTDHTLAARATPVANGAQQVGTWGDFVRGLDATRPVMFGGDGDPNGKADLVSLPAPHDVRQWTRWAEGADLPGPWDHRKPLCLDDFLQLPETQTNLASLLFGDAAYPETALHRSLTETALRSWQVVAARAAGVTGISAWRVDDFDGGAVQQAALYAYRPLGLFLLDLNTEVFAGTVTTRRVAVVNDSGPPRGLELRWRLAPDNGAWEVTGAAPLDAPAGSASRPTLTLALPDLPAAQTKATLKVELWEAGQRVAEDRADWNVYGRKPLSGPVAGAPSRVALLDPVGETRAMLDDLSIGTAPFDATNAPVVLARNRVAVIGKHALPESYPASDPLCAALLAFVRGGGTLLVFEQEHYPRALLPVSLTDQQASIAFARRAEDPLLQGVEEMDLAHWTVGGLVSAREMAKPDWGGFRTIVDSGGPKGLATAGLAELRMGKGRVLLCQLDVTRQYSVDPAATRIVRNLLREADARPADAGKLAVIGGDAMLAPFAAVKVDFDTLPSAQVRGGLNRYRAVVLSDLGIVTDRVDVLRSYVHAGGYVLLHDVTPTGVEVATRLIGGPVVVSENRLGAARLLGRAGLAAGLSNDLLTWRDAEGAPAPRVAPYAVDLPGAQTIVLTDPGVLVVLPYGRGAWVFDEVRWDSPAAPPTLARRYLATLLANLGARFSEP